MYFQEATAVLMLSVELAKMEENFKTAFVEMASLAMDLCVKVNRKFVSVDKIYYTSKTLRY